MRLRQSCIRKRRPSVAVIVSTYNSPRALRCCLAGLVTQIDPEFEVVIADDGSDETTRAVLFEEPFQSLAIRHVWQVDQGYRQLTARNRAIAATKADLLIFLDGDCIPRRDFVAAHRRICQPGCFASGGRINIPPAVHQHFTLESILTHQVFNVDFVSSLDPKLSRYRTRFGCHPVVAALANVLTWRYCALIGCNASAWREDILAVNGFDESIPGYGNDDRDLGVRLHNYGVRGRYRKFSLVVLHLDHPKPYDDPRRRALNRQIFKRRWWDGTTRIELGVDSVTQRA